MEGKAFWLSKTFWVNLLAVIAIVIQSLTGNEILSPERQVQVLGIVNIVLRFITKEPVKWKND